MDDKSGKRKHQTGEASGVVGELEGVSIVIDMLSSAFVTFSRLSSVSKISPGSGREFAGSGCSCCTLREYGVLALPMSASERLLPLPSAERQEYSVPT